MIDKGIGAKYLIQFINMQKEIINIQKAIIQTNDHHILCTGMQTIHMDGRCLRYYK